MYFLLSIIIVVLSALWFVLKHKNRPPGPWNIPILGYLPFLDKLAPYITLTNLSRKYGPIYGLYLGNVYTVVLTDHKIIRKVLAKEVFSGRAPLYVTHGIMHGFGLICAEGDLWRDQRKFVNTCLRNYGVVKNSPRRDKFQELIKTGVYEFTQFLNRNSPEGGFDPLPYLRHSLGNVMNDIVFGHKWSSDDKQWKWLQNLQEEGTKLIGVAGPLNFLPFLRHIPKFKHTMQYLIEGKLKTHELYRALIDKQVDLHNSGSECRNIITSFMEEREIRMKQNDSSVKFYSDDQFYHLLADLFGAGLDTTLTTLRWFYIYMAAFPEDQKRLQEELDDVIDEKNLDVDDMKSLPFTEAALAEAQRIRSVVPIGIPHGALKDSEIEGYTVPKGTMIVPLQWAVHMNPDLWDEPEKFNPGRFLDAEGRFVKPDYFIPFQTGKRMCVGDEMAKMLLFLFGATVLREYQITLPADEKVDLIGECGITLTPKHHRLIFTKRK